MIYNNTTETPNIRHFEFNSTDFWHATAHGRERKVIADYIEDGVYHKLIAKKKISDLVWTHNEGDLFYSSNLSDLSTSASVGINLLGFNHTTNTSVTTPYTLFRNRGTTVKLYCSEEVFDNIQNRYIYYPLQTPETITLTEEEKKFYASGITTQVKMLSGGGAGGGSELSDVLHITSTNIYIGDAAVQYPVYINPDDTRVEVQACDDIQLANAQLHIIIKGNQAYYAAYNGNMSPSYVTGPQPLVEESDGTRKLMLDSTYYKFNKQNVTYLVKHFTYS